MLIFGSITEDTTTQYTRFISVFADEINNEDNYIIDCKTTENNNSKLSYIIFASGNQYTYTTESNSIYKNKIKICENIEDCDFSYNYLNSKYEITVNFKTKTINKTGDNAITYYM